MNEADLMSEFLFSSIGYFKRKNPADPKPMNTNADTDSTKNCAFKEGYIGVYPLVVNPTAIGACAKSYTPPASKNKERNTKELKIY